eukprot:TRINITY_DN13401_c0_g1_i1.p1 TRINITY_DN13401_c0_g1~~TRINITY_DN13401_c0_g1_i1.p1  ORF type:complete len:221 (+),score=-21.34 TRINITY_DN13401_c0_g1_i1:308-970(+)
MNKLSFENRNQKNSSFITNNVPTAKAVNTNFQKVVTHNLIYGTFFCQEQAIFSSEVLETKRFLLKNTTLQLKIILNIVLNLKTSNRIICLKPSFLKIKLYYIKKKKETRITSNILNFYTMVRLPQYKVWEILQQKKQTINIVASKKQLYEVQIILLSQVSKYHFLRSSRTTYPLQIKTELSNLYLYRSTTVKSSTNPYHQVNSHIFSASKLKYLTSYVHF